MSVTLSHDPSITSNFIADGSSGAIESAPVQHSYRNTCLRFPLFASPSIQLLIVAIVCLLCPGMFNALNGLGGAGLLAPGPANESNIALYACFAIVGFFGGFVVNTVGLKPSFFVGGISYAVYAGSFLGYKYLQNRGFLIFGGAFLGLCAGPFWAAQGAMLLSYPSEEQKGRSASLFWAIYNCGAAIGSLVTLCQELRMGGSDTASDSTYITIVVLMFSGALLSLCLYNPKSIKREDGTPVQVEITVSESWGDELATFFKTLRKDYFIILLFPMFLTSNWCYPYQFNTYNLTTFNIRTRALNNFLYWLAEIFGALIVGHTLDNDHFTRSRRSKGLVVGLTVLTFGVWTGGYMWQKKHLEMRVSSNNEKMDFRTPGYVCPMLLYMAYGVFNALWQNCIYWILGKFTSDTRTGAIYAGFYKGIQSAGGAISYRINNSDVSPMNEFLICWILLAVSLAMAAPVITHKIRDELNDENMTTETGADEKAQENVERTCEGGVAGGNDLVDKQLGI